MWSKFRILLWPVNHAWIWIYILIPCPWNAHGQMSSSHYLLTTDPWRQEMHIRDVILVIVVSAATSNLFVEIQCCNIVSLLLLSGFSIYCNLFHFIYLTLRVPGFKETECYSLFFWISSETYWMLGVLTPQWEKPPSLESWNFVLVFNIT